MWGLYPQYQKGLLLVCCAVGLVAFKMCLSVALFFYAGTLHNRELIAREAKNGGLISSRTSTGALNNIERYTSHKGRIIG